MKPNEYLVLLIKKSTVVEKLTTNLISAVHTVLAKTKPLKREFS